MRGEETRDAFAKQYGVESPPRARGRASGASAAMASRRITPACAGKRFCVYFHALSMRNHPRMRGEELHMGEDAGLQRRITPACAGKRVMKMWP